MRDMVNKLWGWGNGGGGLGDKQTERTVAVSLLKSYDSFVTMSMKDETAVLTFHSENINEKKLLLFRILPEESNRSANSRPSKASTCDPDDVHPGTDTTELDQRKSASQHVSTDNVTRSMRCMVSNTQ